MMCCIEAKAVGYLAVWGVSNNTRSYWDNSAAERIGYRPVQNAEDYAGEILRQPNPLDPVAQLPGRQLHDDGLHPAREAAARRREIVRTVRRPKKKKKKKAERCPATA